MPGASYCLPETLDLANVTAVHRDLLVLRGDDLDVDASSVRKLGGLGLQVLMAASLTWERDHRRLRVINQSGPFAEALRLAGAFLPGDPQ